MDSKLKKVIFVILLFVLVQDFFNRFELVQSQGTKKELPKIVSFSKPVVDHNQVAAKYSPFLEADNAIIDDIKLEKVNSNAGKTPFLVSISENEAVYLKAVIISGHESFALIEIKSHDTKSSEIVKINHDDNLKNYKLVIVNSKHVQLHERGTNKVLELEMYQPNKQNDFLGSKE